MPWFSWNNYSKTTNLQPMHDEVKRMPSFVNDENAPWKTFSIMYGKDSINLGLGCGSMVVLTSLKIIGSAGTTIQKQLICNPYSSQKYAGIHFLQD